MNEPVQANLLVPGASREEVFAALLEVERFPEWGFRLKEARVLGAPAGGITPGTTIEFALSAVSLTTKGATGSGGWTLEELGGTVKACFHTSYEMRPLWLDRLANRPFFRGVVGDVLRRSMRRLAERLARD